MGVERSTISRMSEPVPHELMKQLSSDKYKLPYHWIRDPLHRSCLPYFGYLKIVLKNLPAPPAKVLDLGCGDGRIAAEMVKAGYEVTGVDFLETCIIYSKVLVEKGDFIQDDITENLPEKYGFEGKFDAVTLVEVYEHIPPAKCPAVLENARRALRPDGLLIISVPSKALPFSKIHYRHFELEDFERELRQAGFKVNKIIYQYNLNKFFKWILSDRMEKFLNNKYIQPVFLKRMRKRLFMKWGNVMKGEKNCGRYIALARR